MGQYAVANLIATPDARHDTLNQEIKNSLDEGAFAAFAAVVNHSSRCRPKISMRPEVRVPGVLALCDGTRFQKSSAAYLYLAGSSHLKAGDG